MSSSPDDALRAWFIGPRAENADLFERLVTEALRDHVFWRRNYRPEDGFTIREDHKRSAGYEEAVATLTILHEAWVEIATRPREEGGR